MRADNKNAMTEYRDFFVTALLNSASGRDWPVAIFEFAQYPRYRHGANTATIEGGIPVISHYETVVFWHRDFGKIGRRMVLRNKNAVFRAVVAFVENLTG